VGAATSFFASLFPDVTALAAEKLTMDVLGGIRHSLPEQRRKTLSGATIAIRSRTSKSDEIRLTSKVLAAIHNF